MTSSHPSLSKSPALTLHDSWKSASPTCAAMFRTVGALAGAGTIRASPITAMRRFLSRRADIALLSSGMDHEVRRRHPKPRSPALSYLIARLAPWMPECAFSRQKTRTFAFSRG
jgi:hypothetical protein